MRPNDTRNGLSSRRNGHSDRHRADREALLISQRGRLLVLIVDAIAERIRRLLERGEIYQLPQRIPDLRAFTFAVLRLPRP
ncbi:hypothetical protein ACFXPS_28805 [Nocardia sp. NPDC059091]|uniref:hypothetical protein n=1 Tax=unclassified Nocardia TaxID=2637762 RepID=UPI0036C64F18